MNMMHLYPFLLPACKKIILKNKKTRCFHKEFIPLVQMKGVEPPRLSALDPKSSASANFATSAYSVERD